MNIQSSQAQNSKKLDGFRTLSENQTKDKPISYKNISSNKKIMDKSLSKNASFVNESKSINA